jgi:hypothetical protein
LELGLRALNVVGAASVGTAAGVTTAVDDEDAADAADPDDAGVALLAAEVEVPADATADMPLLSCPPQAVKSVARARKVKLRMGQPDH